ncbi:MAG: SDR family oxidoreductase [Candidatus Delongbacteria bacterium]|nr:SDR family oxidoreductase [Candidatus Delongbacteria bacterium]
MNHTSKRAALVTGSGTRLGAKIALELARDGCDIALHYFSSEDEAFETQRKIKKTGRECALFKGDLTDINFVYELVKVAFSTFPHMNILINSASLFKRLEIRDTTPEIFDQLMSLNVRAPFFLIKEFAKFCRSGNIINILDTKTAMYQNAYSAYIISKRALADLTKLAAVEFAPHIRSNGICPGIIIPAEDESSEYVEKLKARNLLGAKGEPSNITRTVKFILENGHITGEIINIDGGENIDKGIRIIT